MAEKYSVIQQHQPLRVPSSWGKQEKAFVMQLEEVLDDIYRRFGRLRLEDLSRVFRDRLTDDEGNIAELIVDYGQIQIDVRNKYDKVNGITIDEDGILVTGSKYVKIASGGTFEVDSTNFKIDSDNGLLKSGSWKFDDKGLTWLDSNNNTAFRLTTYTSESQMNSPGIYYTKNQVGTQYPVYTSAVDIVCINKENNRTHKTNFKIQNQYSSSNDKSLTNIIISGSSPAATNFLGIRGTDDYPLDSVYFNKAIPQKASQFSLYTCDSSLISTLYPGCTDNVNYWVIFDNEVINNALYTRLRSCGTGHKFKIVADVLVGNLTGHSSQIALPRVAESANHLPDINTVIVREYTAGTAYNLPSNAYYHIYEAKGPDTNYGTQLALGMTTDAAYYRKYAGGTWGSWKSLINTDHYDWGDITNKPSTYSPSAHNHGTLHSDFTVSITNTTTDSGWSMINSSYTGFILKSIRFNGSSPSWGVGNYGAGICFGGHDTKGIISCAYDSPFIKIAGGNGTKPVWWIGITGTSGTTYNLSSMSVTWGNVTSKPDTGWVNPATNCWYRTLLGICTVIATGSGSSTKTLFTLPAGSRPKSTLRVPNYQQIQSNGTNCYMEIGTDGAVKLVPNDTSKTQYLTTCTVSFAVA